MAGGEDWRFNKTGSKDSSERITSLKIRLGSLRRLDKDSPSLEGDDGNANRERILPT